MKKLSFLLRSRSKVQLKAYRRVLCVLEEKTDQRNTIAPLAAHEFYFSLTNAVIYGNLRGIGKQ